MITRNNLLNQIKSKRQNFKTYYDVMTEYERQSVQRDIQDLVNANFKLIFQDQAGDLYSKARFVQLAQESRHNAEKKEAASWDTTKLNAGYQLAQTKIDLILKGSDNPFTGVKKDKVLADTLKEVANKGDRHELRAFIETLDLRMNSLPTEVLSNEFLGLFHTEKQRLQESRVTDEMRAALQRSNERTQEFFACKDQIIDENVNILGEPRPESFGFPVTALAMFLKRFQWQGGELQILDENDSRVTGFEIVTPESQSVGG